LQGSKVMLRPPIVDDFEEWSRLRQESRAFLEPWEPTWQPDEFSKMAFRQRVRVYGERARDDQAYAYFVFEKSGGRLAGGLTLSHVRRGVSQSATLGYWIGAPFARRGFMADAIQVISRVAASEFGLHRLEAACIPHNEASKNLLLKCGFEQEGYAKAYVKIAGKWEDHLLFGKLTTQS
jgi:[ribosomal protein S5]-alanine N-acetyltransferase